MKILNLKNLLLKDYFICKYNKNRWGKQQKYNLFSYCKKNNCVILNIFNLFINIKKIILITNLISNNNGILISCFRYNKNLIKKLNIEIKNFYFIFLNKFFGFFTNFYIFLKSLQKLININKTNYNSKRLPSLILMNKNCWKNYDYFFSNFIKLRILSIKSSSFLQKDIYAGYNIILENYYKIYLILKYIYLINNMLKKKW